jgi:hypothetical protein
LMPIVSMLCGLVNRFDNTSDALREDVVEYRVEHNPKPEPRKRMRTRKRKNTAN